MTTLSERLRGLALLLLLLPGLLLAGGIQQRVCLHDWMGIEDACTEQAAVAAPLGCCDRAPEGPSITDVPPCGDCCIELAAKGDLRATQPQGPDDALLLALALPPRCEGLPTLDPGSFARALPGTVRRPPGPGRAPTPLRI